MARLVYLAYFWLLFMPALVLVTVVLGAVCLATAPFIGPRAAGQLTAVPWSRFGLMFSGVNVRISGREHIAPNQSYVIVANHLSHYDIWALYGWLGVDIRWVAKKEVRSIPVIGVACDVGLGHVFIDRGDHRAALASLEAAKTRISHGTSIIFFPEGTRSADGRLKPFKKGAFRMAQDLDLPILPVTIEGTHHVLPKGSALVTPGNITVTIHAPLPAPSKDTASADEMMRRSQAVIEAALAEGEGSPSWPDAHA